MSEPSLSGPYSENPPRLSVLQSLALPGWSQNGEGEVRCMKTFEVRFRYQDRSQGTVESTVKVDASSLPGAVAKAARQFVKGLDRKQKFDMNKNGLEITTKSIEKAETPAGSPSPASD